MKKTRIAFIPADKNNESFYNGCLNSLRKFHSEEELPVLRVEGGQGADFWYKATPIIASQLIKEYETVIKLDCDQVILGSLSHIWEEDFDVAVVQNSNPKDFQNHLQLTGQSLTLLTIPPLDYVNNGLVVMKSEKFVNHWNRICNSPLFTGFPFAEQGFLNLLVHYGDYKVRYLDRENNKWHGLISKMFTPLTKLVGDKVILPKNDEWPKDFDKELVVFHWAGGGNDPAKGNYKLIFPPEVVERINYLCRKSDKIDK